MSTLSTIESRIGSELGRSSSTDQIRNAVTSALRFYERQRFNFNVSRTTSYIPPNSEYIALPDDYVEVDTMLVVEGEERVWLDERSFHWIEEQKEWTNYKSRPTTFAIHAGEMRLYPETDRSLSAAMTYVYRLYEISASSAASDSCAWFTDGEELLRLHAKVDMLENVIRGPESLADASRLRGREDEVLRQMRKLYKRGQSSGRISPGI